MISIVIPVYNAAAYLPALLARLREQTMPHELILIDSESDERTQQIYRDEKVNVVRIKKTEFNHGTTRNLGLRIAQYDTVAFMTQDALPASAETLQRLVEALNSRQDIAMAYGRQLPYPETGFFGQFARIINYPDTSVIKTRELIPEMGVKTCSCSNSFAIYKKQELLNVGGFPSDTILGEDVSVAARFILQGKAVAYCAEAQVFHSHDYTVLEEFKRYFDIGVFHQEQQAVLKEFTRAESEGFKYVMQEWQYLSRHHQIALVPNQLVRVAAKYIGYKMGRLERLFPRRLKSKISMHPGFWHTSVTAAANH
ncbi:glycosyltransferase [Spirosoma rhododendri]|uniref:Glycosyltransferase family 2 protein n=1 Tax=Spirosoma rhododendri TaxID=2728024 RepID=A0A7L5DME1_9BACT|nr:glycosyltransferase [Spirosoma rhododendri]QJD78373.1 glycosyltransferase family 2 protein [Spirosoma rhododendri]